LFVTSKLWNSKHNPNDVLGACKQSLEKLQLEYLDLYLIHSPVSFQDGDEKFPKNDEGKLLYSYHDPCDTWKAMEKLVEQGLVRSIGEVYVRVSYLERRH
jgi:diketogulonate reductase-like aldo/keto reductase